MKIFDVSQVKWALRLFALFVTYLCAECIASAGEPGPRYIKILEGVVTAAIWTTPLWLSTFEIRSWIRYFIALLLLPIALITSIVMLNVGIYMAVFVGLFHLYLIVGLLLRGRCHEGPALVFER